MISMDYALLRELHDLQDTKVLEYLTDKLEETKTQLINAQEESTLRTLQGRAQMLFEIISTIEQAHSKMQDMRRNKPSMNQAF